MTKLPGKFVENIKSELGEESEAFFKSYEDERIYGLRVNRLKISVEDFLKITPFELEAIPWTVDGFYYKESDQPGKHPHYHAGLYYIQEPSAMSPVEILAPQAGDSVLDLCASPGGKSIQIAGHIDDQGLLVVNDISDKRVRPLVRNIERYGLRQIIVLNNHQDDIVSTIGPVFDKVLLDAPCSGEGMFRKDDGAASAWEKFGPIECGQIQREITSVISDVCYKGTKLVYSTCTFNQHENEDVIHEMIESGNFEGLPIDQDLFSVEEHCARLWPHKIKGEGHFISSLISTNDFDKKVTYYDENKPPESFLEFEKDMLTEPLKGTFKEIKGKLYLLPKVALNLKGLKVVREGLLLGELKKNRFVPAQSLAMALKKTDVKRSINLISSDVSAMKYLKGETIHVDGEKGLNLILVDGYPVGWGKLSGTTLKNSLPPSWRAM